MLPGTPRRSKNSPIAKVKLLRSLLLSTGRQALIHSVSSDYSDNDTVMIRLCAQACSNSNRDAKIPSENVQQSPIRGTHFLPLARILLTSGNFNSPSHFTICSGSNTKFPSLGLPLQTSLSLIRKMLKNAIAAHR